MRMNLGACFGPGLFALVHGDQDHDQRTSLELDVSRGGGRVQEKRCRDISPDKIDK